MKNLTAQFSPTYKLVRSGTFDKSQFIFILFADWYQHNIDGKLRWLNFKICHSNVNLSAGDILMGNNIMMIFFLLFMWMLNKIFFLGEEKKYYFASNSKEGFSSSIHKMSFQPFGSTKLLWRKISH